MDFKLRKSKITEIEIAFNLLKEASILLSEKNISQWNYWQNPPKEKIDWVKQGFYDNEFYFIENDFNEIMGMVRILDKDLIYWGNNNDSAKYIHSLIIKKKFSGYKLGEKVIDKIENTAKIQQVNYLRLDCDATNSKLCDYYINQGFKKVGEIKLPLSIYNLYQREIN